MLCRCLSRVLSPLCSRKGLLIPLSQFDSQSPRNRKRRRWSNMKETQGLQSRDAKRNIVTMGGEKNEKKRLILDCKNLWSGFEKQGRQLRQRRKRRTNSSQVFPSRQESLFDEWLLGSLLSRKSRKDSQLLLLLILDDAWWGFLFFLSWPQESTRRQWKETIDCSYGLPCTWLLLLWYLFSSHLIAVSFGFVCKTCNFVLNFCLAILRVDHTRDSEDEEGSGINPFSHHPVSPSDMRRSCLWLLSKPERWGETLSLRWRWCMTWDGLFLWNKYFYSLMIMSVPQVDQRERRLFSVLHSLSKNER